MTNQIAADVVADKNKKKYILPSKPKKRLFIGMLFLTVLLLGLLLAGIWYIARPGLAGIWEPLPILAGVFFALAVFLGLWGLLTMVLAVQGLPYLPILRKQTYMLINMLFPLAVRLGKFFGIRRRQLEGSFIAVSNLLFARLGIKVPAEKLLVITPHCLQLATCPHKITRDPHNCKRCGGCDIGPLVTLSEEMGFTFFVATGGTLARQIIYEKRPKAVVAIACERDLMSGIQDVYPLPAVGVLNIRPNGPCFNTHVDLDEVRAQIENLTIPATKPDEAENKGESHG